MGRECREWEREFPRIPQWFSKPRSASDLVLRTAYCQVLMAHGRGLDQGNDLDPSHQFKSKTYEVGICEGEPSIKTQYRDHERAGTPLGWIRS